MLMHPFLVEKSMEKEHNKYGWKGVYQETIKHTFISKDFENRDRYEKDTQDID